MDRLDNDPQNQEAALPAGAPVRAHLKWFNGPKGFGFVVPEDRPDTDAFLHITALQKAGITAIGDNACLSCHVQYGPRGAHVTHIVEMITAGDEPKPIQPADSGGNGGKTQKMSGTIKWYNTEKEFGFVVPDDGRKDVFIHRTCLEKNGLHDIKPGQRVTMTFRDVPKGREVISLTLIDES